MTQLARQQARADQIFALWAPKRAEHADQQVAHRPERLRPYYRATALRYLEAYDRTFAMQRARAEARNALDQQPVEYQDACRAHGRFFAEVAA